MGHRNIFVQGQLGPLKGAGCCWSGTDTAFAWQRKRRFLYFSIVSLMRRKTLAVANTQKHVTCNLPGVLSRKKDFWIELLGWLHPKCFIGLSGSVAASEGIPRRPSDPSLSHFKDNVFGSTCAFSGTKLKKLKRKNPNRFFFSKGSKNVLFKIFRQADFKLRDFSAPFQERKFWKKVRDFL